MHCVPTGFRKGLEASIIICSVIGCNTMLKGGSVQWQIQKFDENPSTSRGVWGHAPPGNFDIFVL